MSEPWLIITEKAKTKLRIGELIATWTLPEDRAVVTDKRVKEYALSLRDSNPLWWDDAYAAREGLFGHRVAPALLAMVFNPLECGAPPECRCPASAFWAELRGVPDNGEHWGGHDAFHEFDFFKPLKLGDRIVSCEIRNRDCFEKRGRKTLLVCVVSEYTLINQRREIVVVCRVGIMTQFAYPAGIHAQTSETK